MLKWKSIYVTLLLCIPVKFISCSPNENDLSHIYGILNRMLPITNGIANVNTNWLNIDWATGQNTCVYLNWNGNVGTLTLNTSVENLTANIKVDREKLIVTYTVEGQMNSVERIRNAVNYATRNWRSIPRNMFQNPNTMSGWENAYAMVTLQYDKENDYAKLVLQSIPTISPGLLR